MADYRATLTAWAREHQHDTACAFLPSIGGPGGRRCACTGDVRLVSSRPCQADTSRAPTNRAIASLLPSKDLAGRLAERGVLRLRLLPEPRSPKTWVGGLFTRNPAQGNPSIQIPLRALAAPHRPRGRPSRPRLRRRGTGRPVLPHASASLARNRSRSASSWRIASRRSPRFITESIAPGYWTLSWRAPRQTRPATP